MTQRCFLAETAALVNTLSDGVDALETPQALGRVPP